MTLPQVDERIRSLKQYLYNDGKGKFIPIDEIVQARSGKIADVEKRKSEISVTSLEAVTDSDSDMSRKNGKLNELQYNYLHVLT